MKAIDSKVEILNRLQKKVFETHSSLSASEKEEWRNTVNTIESEGYSLKKKRMKDCWGKHVGIVWSAVQPRKRHFSAELKIVDMRPSDGLSIRKGDCTTRAMAYCLRGVFSYREIEREQYRLAEEANREHGLCRGDGWGKVRRNSMGTWDKVMVDFGWKWIRLSKTVRRDNLAVLLRGVSSPVISRSSGHVAIVEGGNVIDTWDSRHGRCMMVLVGEGDLPKVEEILKENHLIR